MWQHLFKKGIFFMLLCCLFIPSVSVAHKLCKEHDDVVAHEFGRIPYINGHIDFESRRESQHSRSTYIWSITENTTGYVLEIKWGTKDDKEKYFPKTKIASDLDEPRCYALTRSAPHDTDKRIFSYKRKGWSDWEEEDPTTVFESTSINITDELLDVLSDIVVLDAQAQTTSDAIRLRTQYESRTLPEMLRPYYTPRFGLASDKLMEDSDALRAYFTSGFSVLQNYAFLVADFPRSPSAVRDFVGEGDMESEQLTPIYVYVAAEIRPHGDRFQLSYRIYSEVLQNDLSKTYDADSFYQMNLRFVASIYDDTHPNLKDAFGRNESKLLVHPEPGIGRATEIEIGVADSFELAGFGTLTMELENPVLDIGYPVMRFPLVTLSD